MKLSVGAGDGTRTRNLLITSQLLYQLSYASTHTTAQIMELGVLREPQIKVKYFFKLLNGIQPVSFSVF